MEENTKKTPPATRARNKRHYIKMLAEGRCTQCGTVDDRTRQGRCRCAECNEKSHPNRQRCRTEEQRQIENEDKREWARMRKAAHVCVSCGTQDANTISGRSYCKQCATKRAYRQRETWNYEHEKVLRDARREKWRKDGLCTNCGHEKEEPGKAMCLNCRVRAKLRKEKHKINNGWLPRGFNGKCYQCNREQAIPGKRLCQSCYEKKIEVLRENSKHKAKAKEG